MIVSPYNHHIETNTKGNTRHPAFLFLSPEANLAAVSYASLGISSCTVTKHTQGLTS